VVDGDAVASKNATARTDVASIHYYCGQLVDAERDVRAALRLDPHFAQAHGVLAGVLAEQGRFGEALRSYEAPLRRDPRVRELMRQLGISAG
jgi:tetratricopeptide (TPR) repeat protein